MIVTPLCVLPCTVRFAIWSLRVARLSAEGSLPAHLRIEEVHTVLQRRAAAHAVERFVALLLRERSRPVEIRELGRGSTYCSAGEIDLLAALGWLQAGEKARAQQALARYTTVSGLPAFLEAAASWTAQLREIGVLLHVQAGGAEPQAFATRAAEPASKVAPLH